MSWEDQGRQEHGWFGHGTAPPKLKPDEDSRGCRFGPDGLDQRIRAMGHTAIAAMPRSLRHHSAASYEGPALDRLVTTMREWVYGLLLDRAEFASRYFGRRANDPIVNHLWQATKFATVACNEGELRTGTEHLAAAMQSEGLDRWRRFLADAQQRATVASTTATTDTLAPTAPVPLVNDQGNPVITPQGPYAGQQMLFPAGLDPHFFVAQGLQDKQIEDTMMQNGDPGAALAYETAQLAKFNHGFAWDAQRIGGSVNQQFIDYATVAIGLYGAASGLPIDQNLTIQNAFAGQYSKFGNVTYDKTYTNLPTRNVANTQLGYDLYQSGLIGPAKRP